eukprot:TRINITY_DN133_c0_g1_i6.p1 TRINITY_DN133_c0_g1~~TRINITY_DN133_c0_g1_i6.p1  ORF type:complete len:261 (+),score=50.27 TRINITY_DN133_c0_g1_i6:758-1540(+)
MKRRKITFLDACTAQLIAKNVECIDVVSGSVIVTYQGTNEDLDKVINSQIAATEFQIPGYPALPVMSLSTTEEIASTTEDPETTEPTTSSVSETTPKLIESTTSTKPGLPEETEQLQNTSSSSRAPVVEIVVLSAFVFFALLIACVAKCKCAERREFKALNKLWYDDKLSDHTSISKRLPGVEKEIEGTSTTIGSPNTPTGLDSPTSGMGSPPGENSGGALIEFSVFSPSEDSEFEERFDVEEGADRARTKSPETRSPVE